MRYLFGLVSVLAIGLLPLIGCSDTADTGGSGGTGGTAGAGGSAGDGGEGGAGGTRAELRLFVQGWEDGAATGALPGVEICEMDTDNCVTTNDQGNAVIELPAEQEAAITLAKEGYASYLDSHIIPATGGTEAAVLATYERLDAMHELVDSPYPMEGTGTLYVEALDAYVGATLALVGDATGKQWYRDENTDWDTDLTATTSGGGGGFSELAPGTVQVDIGDASCTVIRGWPGDADNRLKLPIREGFLSRTDVRCEAP